MNEDDVIRLRKKARKKYLSTSLAAELVRVHGSPMNKQYAMTFACCDLLAINDKQELSAQFYCQKRWCQTCQSVKMATMINKYLPVIDELDGLQFVTLTLPTVEARDIPQRWADMAAAWRRLTDLARKTRPGFRGLRKTELKVSAGNHGRYHLHYHILLQGGTPLTPQERGAVDLESNGAWLVRQWLKMWTTASAKAQDVRPVRDTERAVVELMKYATKLTCAENSGNEISELCEPWQLDVIFTNLYGKRLYQPFGGLKGYDEDSFEVTAEIVKRARGLYQWVGHDWFHTEFGQALTGWTAEEVDIAIQRRKTNPKYHTPPQKYHTQISEIP